MCPVLPSFLPFALLPSEMPPAYQYYTKKASELVGMLDRQITIPPHQREFCWSPPTQYAFIETVEHGEPVNEILLRKHDDGKITLEDGRQRLTTLQKFLSGETKDSKKGRRLTDLPADLKKNVDDCVFSICCYAGATDQEAIRIFDRRQNGVALSVGQRMHSLEKYPSPIVACARRLLLTAGEGLCERAKKVWGYTPPPDKRCNTLVGAVVLVSGIVFRRMTENWSEIDKYQLLYQPLGMSDAAISEALGWVISIYEEVDRRYNIGGKDILKIQWSMSNFNPYIIWSYNKYPADRERLFKGWVAFLVAYRHEPRHLRCQLLADVTGEGPNPNMRIKTARKMDDARWEAGYNRVFNADGTVIIAEFPALAAEGAVIYHEDDEEDEESDE